MSIQTKGVSKLLQGLLVSLTNATGVIGPLLFAVIYSFTTNLGWLDLIIGLAFYCIIILLSMTFMLTPQAQGVNE